MNTNGWNKAARAIEPYPKRNNELLNYVFLVLAIISGVVVRIWWSTLNGVLLWETAFWGSLVYNGVPIGSSGLLVIVILSMLYPTLVTFNNKIVAQEDNTHND